MGTRRIAGWATALALLAAFVARADEPDAGAALRTEVGKALERIYAVARADARKDFQCPKGWAAEDWRLSQCLAAATKEMAEGPVGARAAMIALALWVDDSDLYARNPMGGGAFAGLETPALLAEKKTLRGKPSIQERHDWAQHFFVSAAVAAQLSAELSLRAGYAKEISDAKEMETGKGSGFSFADLGADYAGIELTRRLLKDGPEAKALRERMAAGATMRDVCPDLKDLPEDLPHAEWVKQYGGPQDERYRTMIEKIRRRIDACAAYAQAGEK